MRLWRIQPGSWHGLPASGMGSFSFKFAFNLILFCRLFSKNFYREKLCLHI